MKDKNRLTSGFHGTMGIFVSSVAAVVLFLLYAVMCTVTEISPLILGLVIAAVYIIAILVISVLLRPRIDLEIKESSLHPVLGEIMLSSMVNIITPAIIADCEEHRIIWYNKEAANIVDGEKKLSGAVVTDIFTFDEKRSGGDTKYISVNDRILRAKISSVTAGDGTYELYSFTDITELEKTLEALCDHEVMVAYIMVDNIDELLQHEQEEYRYAASRTEEILRAFATEANGILKEYQADRYIFFFEAKKFNDFVAKRFDVLDRVREVRVGTGSTPITISMGISNAGGSFAEKEKGAQAALEMALQRGGDQVVVKNRDGSQSIYGGRTKMIQKKAKVRARTVANEILVRISESSNVIVMAHKRPDFDALGASLGIARLCMFCGVPVNVVTDFSYSGIEKCLERIKDLTDYEDVLIDKEKALDLVSPDTLLVIVDVNNAYVFEEPHLAESCDRIIVIDHHRKTAEFPKEPIISYIEPSAAATCELVSEMLEQVLPGELLLPREADIMFAGILLDTNQFRKNTGTRTFSAALYLRDRGADISAIQEFFKTTLEDYERENKFRTNVFTYRDIMAISVSESEGDSSDNIPASRAADKLLELEGIKASFVLFRLADTIHISARSVGTINVQLILEQLKGGGHFDSAGTQMKDITTKDAVEMLKKAIDKYLDESTNM